MILTSQVNKQQAPEETVEQRETKKIQGHFQKRSSIKRILVPLHAITKNWAALFLFWNKKWSEVIMSAGAGEEVFFVSDAEPSS